MNGSEKGATAASPSRASSQKTAPGKWLLPVGGNLVEQAEPDQLGAVVVREQGRGHVDGGYAPAGADR